MIRINSNIFSGIEDAYIIGGSVRDFLLGRTPIDYDIAVSGNPEEIAKILAARTNGRIVELGKPDRMIIRVVSSDAVFDITSLTDGSLKADLERRDFTINAMAFALRTGEITDPLGGLKDLADKKIRMVSTSVFRNDPIRLIRAYRMSADLDFEIEPLTVSVIHSDADLIQNTAGERIRSELFKMLRSRKSHDYLRQMSGTRLLAALFPEIESLKGCFQNAHHRYDVFEHTLQAYDHLEAMLNGCSDVLTDITRRLTAAVDEDRAVLLKCAVLLHDIGKPAKRTVDSRGETRFFGHSKKSADMAAEVSGRLKFSNNEKRFIDFIIRNHLRPLLLFLAHRNNTLTQRGQTRFFMHNLENTPFLLLHTLADTMGKEEEHHANNSEFFAFIEDLARVYLTDIKPRSHLPPLITGHDLIKAFGLSPSPLFKTLLGLVAEARLSKTVCDRTDALQLVKDFLNQSG